MAVVSGLVRSLGALDETKSEVWMMVTIATVDGWHVYLSI